MKSLTRLSIFAAALVLAHSAPAVAQSWTGLHVGGAIGAAIQPSDASETVKFDTNLDGSFTDTVRTAAGADAFSPGFCGGVAKGPQPTTGCTADTSGVDLSGHVGYDWQIGHFVVGGLLDVARSDMTDGVTAFSTTPAFYALSRELKSVAALRGRVGIASRRVIIYGTAGSAWANIDHLFTSSNTVNTFVPAKDVVRSERSGGYEAGGGAEFRLAMRWSVVGEYLFTSIDDAADGTVRSQGPAPATNPFILVNSAGTDLRRADRFEFHGVRAGLNYRF